MRIKSQAYRLAKHPSSEFTASFSVRYTSQLTTYWQFDYRNKGWPFVDRFSILFSNYTFKRCLIHLGNPNLSRQWLLLHKLTHSMTEIIPMPRRSRGYEDTLLIVESAELAVVQGTTVKGAHVAEASRAIVAIAEEMDGMRIGERADIAMEVAKKYASIVRSWSNYERCSCN